MQTSIFLAKVIGLFMLFMSMGAFTRRQYFLKMIQGFTDPMNVFYSGIFALIIGVMLVVSHNIWIMQWPVMVTLIAWFVLLNGVVRLYFPEYCSKLAEKVFNHPKYQLIIASSIFLLAIYFLYFGFFS